MSKSIISLGSNTSKKLEHIKACAKQISRITKIYDVSFVYESKSWGFEGRDFYNVCLLLHTDISPENLMKAFLDIEIGMGRIRTNQEGYQDRNIDIDMLFYDDLIYHTDILALPHPHISKRRFVLQPLCDLIPDFYHPILGLCIRDLLKMCEDKSILKQQQVKIL